MAMKFPPHPGLSVRYSCMEPMGLDVAQAAKLLRVSEKRVSSLINCRSGITRELAVRLHEVFGGGAETWYRLQVAYDHAVARNRIEHYRDRTRPWHSVRRAWRKLSEAANKALGKHATGLGEPERIERKEDELSERLAAEFLENDPSQRARYSNVQPYAIWAGERGWRELDTGIDLVAELVGKKGFVAFRCRRYGSDGRIREEGLDSFVAASRREPFAQSIIVYTAPTDWSNNVVEKIHGQKIPVLRVNPDFHLKSSVRREGFESVHA